MGLRSTRVFACVCGGVKVGSLLLKMLCKCLLFSCIFLSLCLQSVGLSSAPVPSVTAPGSNEAARATLIEPCQGCPLRPQCVCQLINPSLFLLLRHLPFLSWHGFKSRSPHCARGDSGMESNWCYFIRPEE